MKTLTELEAADYCTDEWSRWQQGGCLEYAYALVRLDPELSFGAILNEGVETHFFAHDGRFAYDSAGRHPLPYLGIAPHAAVEQELDVDPGWYDDPDPDLIIDAMQHAVRNRILSG